MKMWSEPLWGKSETFQDLSLAQPGKGEELGKGYIEARVGSGTFVTSHLPEASMANGRAPRISLSSRLRRTSRIAAEQEWVAERARALCFEVVALSDFTIRYFHSNTSCSALPVAPPELKRGVGVISRTLAETG